MDDYRNSPTIKFCVKLFPAHRCPSATEVENKTRMRERELIKRPINFYGLLSGKESELIVKSEIEIAKNSTSN